MTLKFPVAKSVNMTIISVYAPTLQASDEVKDTFYEQLSGVMKSVPSNNKILLLGDFNARVGKDHQTCSRALGKFCRGNVNDNGDLLLSLCTEYDLAITNTFFNVPDKWYYSWTHP